MVSRTHYVVFHRLHYSLHIWCFITGLNGTLCQELGQANGNTHKISEVSIVYVLRYRAQYASRTKPRMLVVTM